MNFVNPSFLWALLVLAIPVIIHLFHFRRYKTVYFSNVNFLKEVQQERNNIRQVKRWLLLLSRLLLLFFLVLAFAQPFFKGKSAGSVGKNAVSIYLDNSYSMGLKNKGVELLEWGKDRAVEIVKSGSAGDEYLILTNDLKVEEQRWKSQEDALNYINGIEVSAKSLPLETIVQKQVYLFSKSKSDNLKNYLVSDFQQSALANLKIEKDSLHTHYFVHLQADNVKNIYVDSIWMVNPVNRLGSSNVVLYRIKNSSELDVENLSVTLKINDEVQAVRELNLMPEEARIDTLYFTVYKEGWQLAEVSLTDYPITMDDQFFFSFEVKKTRKVLEIIDGNTPNTIKSVFSSDEWMDYLQKESGQLDYSDFQSYDLIVLNELDNISSGLESSTKQYIESGGNVLLIPSANGKKEIYAGLLANIGGIQLADVKQGKYSLLKPNLTDPLIKGIVAEFPPNTVMPNVSKYFPIATGARVRQQNILVLNNSEPLLARFPSENGNLFIQTVPNQAAFSEFQNHWSYAPIIYNIAIAGGLGKSLYVINGLDEWVVVENKIERKDDVVTVSNESMELIPEQRVMNNRLFVNIGKSDQISSGHYTVALGEKTLANISVNLNRLESEMKFANEAELRKDFPEVAAISSGLDAAAIQNINLNSNGRPLWRVCLILALLFLISEVLILRFMRD
jgi:hypothetical protein